MNASQPHVSGKLKKGLKNGAEVYEAQNKAEIQAFTKVMRRIYSACIRRYFPDLSFFGA